MNCKQGDIAVIVKSANVNEGRVVTCLRLATFGECEKEGVAWWLVQIGPVWVIDSAVKTICGGFVNLFPDARMRPLRDSDGEDETLTWAGKPEKVPS